jgi:succinyl-CoA--D-citramalate CoA-transferase
MPLAGMRVLELGSFIAGPFCGRLLADFGAEVIKVEPPGKGDPMRGWGPAKHQGRSLWWPVQSRNKKCITLNLASAEGQALVMALVRDADILIENFRPGTMEGWGLGYEALRTVNPAVIMVRISGFGQTGPYKDRAGFGSVGEAMGGVRYVTGYPDRPPVRTGISLGDSVAAMFGVIGALMAVYQRDRSPERRGQVIDVALYEAVFALMESSLSEYMKVGAVRERTGNIVPGVAPSNLYPTKDGKWIAIGGNADNVWRRLAGAMGRAELADDPRYKTHDARGEHQAELDELIAAWTKAQSMTELSALLAEAGVPAGGIFSVEDIVNDLHYQARDMIIRVQDEALGDLHLPGVVPKLSETPGRIAWTGPGLGEHNDEVFLGLLGLGGDEYQELKDSGVI